MRVLSVYYTHKPGGFCKRLYRLLNALKERNHVVLYLSLDQPPKDLSSSVTWQRIPFPLRQRSGVIFWILFIIWCPLYSAWSAWNFRPDRYVAFNPFYSAVLLFARLLRAAPIVLFMRSLVFRINRVTSKNAIACYLSDIIDRLGLRLATRVICMTEAMRCELIEFLGWVPPRIEVLPNDLPLFQKGYVPAEIVPEKFNIIAAGVLDSRKNLRLLIEAIALLSDQIQEEINVLIVGEGYLSESLKEKASELSLRSVSFLGWKPDLAPYLGSAQLLIHPSLHEGVSNTVMEALAADVPVLASDIPEHRELLLSEDLLFGVDDTQGLADKIVALLSSSEKRARVAALCKARAEAFRFDWDSSAAGMVLG